MASSHDWAPHLCGAKRIIDVGSKANVLRQDEDHLLLDWVYYHEVSSEFTLRHWMVPKELARMCQKEPRAQPPRVASSTALVRIDNPSSVLLMHLTQLRFPRDPAASMTHSIYSR